jgi:hypothetical protein
MLKVDSSTIRPKTTTRAIGVGASGFGYGGGKIEEVTPEIQFDRGRDAGRRGAALPARRGC